MKRLFKGHEIEVRRGSKMVSNNVLFCSITRLSDGYLVFDDICYDSCISVFDKINELKIYASRQNTE